MSAIEPSSISLSVTLIRKLSATCSTESPKEKFGESLGFDDEQFMTKMMFSDFQREDKYDEYGKLEEEATFVYEAAPDIESIRKRAMTRMEAYNEKYPSKPMNLVIFDDALKHLLRIKRFINSPSGNILT